MRQAQQYVGVIPINDHSVVDNYIACVSTDINRLTKDKKHPAQIRFRSKIPHTIIKMITT